MKNEKYLKNENENLKKIKKIKIKKIKIKKIQKTIFEEHFCIDESN